MEADECSWIEGDPYSPECTPPTPEPTAPTAGPTRAWPTPSPSDESGCCYGSSPSANSYCAGLNENSRACDAAAQCDWIVTDDPSECELTEPPAETTTPAPSYSVEGCCTGYSPRTFSFCNGFTNGADCEMAGVCSGIATSDPEECEPPTEPPSYTEPPAPTYGGKGCCAGNSPRTWSFCGTLSDDEAMCHEAEECTWIPTEDPYSDECQPPTKEPTRRSPHRRRRRRSVIIIRIQ